MSNLPATFHRVFHWYQANEELRWEGSSTTRKSAALLMLAFSDHAKVTETEIKVFFHEVLHGNLSWGRKGSDGLRRMEEYIESSLNSTEVNFLDCPLGEVQFISWGLKGYDRWISRSCKKSLKLAEYRLFESMERQGRDVCLHRSRLGQGFSDLSGG